MSELKVPGRQQFEKLQYQMGLPSEILALAARAQAVADQNLNFTYRIVGVDGHQRLILSINDVMTNLVTTYVIGTDSEDPMEFNVLHSLLEKEAKRLAREPRIRNKAN